MRRHSPYNYAFDNPIFFIDPDGMAPAGFGLTDWSKHDEWAEEIDRKNRDEDEDEDEDESEDNNAENNNACPLCNFQIPAEAKYAVAGSRRNQRSQNGKEGKGEQNGESNDPYMNSDGEPVYTMAEFIQANKGLTRNEIINQRNDKSVTFLRSQPGGPSMRFVINPHDGRVLDMRHMLIVGNYPGAAGNLIEVLQWVIGDKSGMNPQDFYSNGVGYQFYVQSSSLQRLFAPATFTDQLNSFFSNPRIMYNW